MNRIASLTIIKWKLSNENRNEKWNEILSLSKIKRKVEIIFTVGWNKNQMKWGAERWNKKNKKEGEKKNIYRKKAKRNVKILRGKGKRIFSAGKCTTSPIVFFFFFWRFVHSDFAHRMHACRFWPTLIHILFIRTIFACFAFVFMWSSVVTSSIQTKWLVFFIFKWTDCMPIHSDCVWCFFFDWQSLPANS